MAETRIHRGFSGWNRTGTGAQAQQIRPRIVGPSTRGYEITSEAEIEQFLQRRLRSCRKHRRRAQPFGGPKFHCKTLRNMFGEPRRASRSSAEGWIMVKPRTGQRLRVT
jgi:hypothetical protein